MFFLVISLTLLTHLSDQYRISPYNIDTISGRVVMRITKTSNKELLVNSIPNSLNEHCENCMTDNEESYKRDLRSKRVKVVPAA